MLPSTQSVPEVCPYRGWDLYMRESWEHYYTADLNNLLWVHTMTSLLIESFAENDMESILKVNRMIYLLHFLSHLELSRSREDTARCAGLSVAGA